MERSTTITPYKKSTKGTSKRPYKRTKLQAQFRPGTPGFGRQRRLVSLGMGLPSQLKMQMKYRETVSITGSIGAMGTYLFSANSLFDPNQTGTGHQPLYYDQIQALYSYYTVQWSKIKVRFSQGSTGNTAATVALSLNEDTTVTPTDIDGVIEQSNAKSITLGPSSTDWHDLASFFSLKQRFGSPADPSNANFRASGANPTDRTFFQLNVQAVDRSSTLSVFAEVAIDYGVLWTDVREIAQS